MQKPQNTFDLLGQIVQKVTCKKGWSFWLQETESEGLRLVIRVEGTNSFHPEQQLNVLHFFPVPFATYNEATWRRWIFDCCRGVENHELGEWFKVDGHRPFAPLHGPGENPYVVHEFRPEIDARTVQDGSVIESV